MALNDAQEYILDLLAQGLNKTELARFGTSRSMYRTLKPGGRALVLEFSKPVNPVLGKAYDAFSTLWPVAGKVVTGDADSYKYLVESIRMHPDQETLKTMMQDAGFRDCKYHNLIGGISAIHVGYR
jgi:demethylmenaquinone methyltransferase/2-methoxy-6-polyprenyl-1,4-benzoquinol methylase